MAGGESGSVEKTPRILCLGRRGADARAADQSTMCIARAASAMLPDSDG